MWELDIRCEYLPSRPIYWEDLLEYRTENWRPVYTCCPSDTSERPQANADVKKKKHVRSKNNKIKCEKWISEVEYLPSRSHFYKDLQECWTENWRPD